MPMDQPGRKQGRRPARPLAKRGNRPARPRCERLDGAHVVQEALRARRREFHRLLVAPPHGGAASGLDAVLEEAERAGVPIEWVAPEELRTSDASGNSQHVALEAGPLPELPLARLILPGAEPRETPRWLVLLDGVEDPQNLGAIARVAEAAGACGLILGERRAPPLSPAASRASAGALEWLPVARVGNLAQAIAQLKEHGFWSVSAEPAASDSLFGVAPRVLTGDLVLVLGSEGRGVRPGIAAVVDHRVRIPLAGRIASLNVATAGAVILFELVRRAELAAIPVAGAVASGLAHE